jgi:hypothetical protein
MLDVPCTDRTNSSEFLSHTFLWHDMIPRRPFSFLSELELECVSVDSESMMGMGNGDDDSTPSSHYYYRFWERESVLRRELGTQKRDAGASFKFSFFLKRRSIAFKGFLLYPSVGGVGCGKGTQFLLRNTYKTRSEGPSDYCKGIIASTATILNDIWLCPRPENLPPLVTVIMSWQEKGLQGFVYEEFVSKGDKQCSTVTHASLPDLMVDENCF